MLAAASPERDDGRDERGPPVAGLVESGVGPYGPYLR
jgi:hypothetical protein